MEDYFDQFTDKRLEDLLLEDDNFDILAKLCYQNNSYLELDVVLRKAVYELNGSELGSLDSRDLRTMADIVAMKVTDILDIPYLDPPHTEIISPFMPFLHKSYFGSAVSFALTGASLFSAQPEMAMFPAMFGAAFVLKAYLKYQEAKSTGAVFKHPFWDEINYKIFLNPESPGATASTFAHEYTHFLQSQYGFNRFDCPAFSEGVARGVQRHIASDYSKFEDLDPMKRINQYDADECRHTLLWACNQKGWLEDNAMEQAKDFELGPHALGNAALSVLEAKHGPDIYKRIFHRDFNLESA